MFFTVNNFHPGLLFGGKTGAYPSNVSLNIFPVEKFRVIAPAIMTHDCNKCTCLGHLGQCDTNRNDPINESLPKEAKASPLSVAVDDIFAKKTLPMYLSLYWTEL